MKNIKTYGPAFGLALLIAISAPFMRPAQSQPLAERLSRINAQRKEPAQVVILEFQESFVNQPEYAMKGYTVINSSSSAGAPTFPNYPEQGVSASQAIADLLNSGFEIQSYTWNIGTFIKRPVRD